MFKELKELVIRNRSYRRFDGSVIVKEDTLRELIALARLTPSSYNLQPLKYMLSADPEKNCRIFPCLTMGSRLPDQRPLPKNKRPAAYIIILGDTAISQSAECDLGIAAQTILLGAVERGLGGCMVGSVDRRRLRRELNIPSPYSILMVIALGKPAEKVVIESLAPGKDTAYWRDANGVHHVPKRSLDELILDE